MLTMILFSSLMLSASREKDSVSIQATVSREPDGRFKNEIVLRNASSKPLGMMGLDPVNPIPLGSITVPDPPDSIWYASVEYEQDGEGVHLAWVPRIRPFDTFPIRAKGGVFRAVFYSTSVDAIPMKFEYSIIGPKGYEHSGAFKSYPPK
jgi:hypothetical protein